MNTNKIYMGTLKKVTNIKYKEEIIDSICFPTTQINCTTCRLVLVKQNKYGYKDILTKNTYKEESVLLQKGDFFVSNDDLVSFNKRFNNQKKYLSKKKILSKF